ncbi:MAG TPA: two-component regulator propeller domain-containing protein, partial [Chthoniobacterales bacterium]|nr:two-component regulator propeller domain-containing protein [Chthoniobacterales bacterium]
MAKRKPLPIEGFLRISLAALCLLAFLPLCLAVDPVRSLEQLRVANWNQQNGLLQDTTNALAQTVDGFLWVASDEGLMRFDGAEFFVPGEFQQKPLLRRSAYCLCNGPGGELWIGSYAGIYRRVRKGRFEYLNQTAGLPNSEITAVATDSEGTVWVGTYEAGLFWRNGDQFVEFAPAQELRQQKINRICPTTSRDLWVGASGGLYRINRSNGDPQLLSATNGFAGKSITALTMDPFGRLWVGTNEGLTCLDQDMLYPIGLPQDAKIEVTALFTDSHGMIWIGSRNGGIWRMLPDPKIGGAEFRSLSSLADSRRNALISTFCEDGEGDIWVGSDAGLFRISDTRFIVYNSRQGLPGDLANSVLPSRSGKIWVGTDAGLAFLPGPASARAASLPPVSPILSEPVTALYEDSHNSLWVGTASGDLQRFRQEPFSAEGELSRFSPATQVDAICEVSPDDTWVGTNGAGLHWFHQGELIRSLTEQDGITNNIVHTLAVGPDNTLWIAAGHGLLKWTNGKLEDAIRKGSPVHDRSFVSLLIDADGTIWAGTFGYGLARIQNGDAGALCDAAHGLFSDELFTLLKDDRGYLWASSDRGIFATKISELNEYFDGKRSTVDCRRFTAADGLVTAECIGGNSTTSCRTSDGRLWFVTVGGIAVTSHGNLTADLRSPPVVLERLIADLTHYIPLRSSEPPTVLNPDTHSIEIHYAGLSLSAPEALLYRYKLEGFDPTWIDAGIRRVAYYTNLPPGHYRFHVLACNRDGIWTPENLATSGEFVLPPHFYQTWWFYALCAGLIGLLIWALYCWRLQQILQERARLARDLHDTLAQGLVGILWQTESAIKSQRKGQGAEAIQILERTSILARETLMEARGALRALRAGILSESSSLVNALEKLVRKGTSDTPLQTEVRVRGQPFQVRSKWEQALGRIT